MYDITAISSEIMVLKNRMKKAVMKNVVNFIPMHAEIHWETEHVLGQIVDFVTLRGPSLKPWTGPLTRITPWKTKIIHANVTITIKLPSTWTPIFYILLTILIDCFLLWISLFINPSHVSMCNIYSFLELTM